jgi:hypothetical protein
MLNLNTDIGERKAGYLFMSIWLLILAFYLTWDGWVYEWEACGYSGPNQHFDLDFFDMRYEVINGQIKYISTNNLHNIIYLCYYGLLIAWLGLLTGNKYLKHGAMSLTSVMFLSILFTLRSSDHQYLLQFVWDIVHFSSVIACIYLFYKNKFILKWALPVLFSTWVIYYVSLFLLKPWPFWEHNNLAYYGINQINKMPFYFYGLEYSLAIFIILAINIGISWLQPKFPDKRVRTVLPLLIGIVAYLVLLFLGLVEIEHLDIGTC